MSTRLEIRWCHCGVGEFVPVNIYTSLYHTECVVSIPIPYAHKSNVSVSSARMYGWDHVEWDITIELWTYWWKHTGPILLQVQGEIFSLEFLANKYSTHFIRNLNFVFCLICFQFIFYISHSFAINVLCAIVVLYFFDQIRNNWTNNAHSFT